jgi:hypothetical protein
MANVRFLYTGFVVSFDHHEVTQITTAMNTAANTAGTVTGLLLKMGISPTSQAISGTVGTLLKLGATALNRCNHKRSGIHLLSSGSLCLTGAEPSKLYSPLMPRWLDQVCTRTPHASIGRLIEAFEEFLDLGLHLRFPWPSVKPREIHWMEAA